MADASRDFWPDMGTVTPIITTPLGILKEQAAALARKTKGLLEGRVDSYTDTFDGFLHHFRIVAPTLNNYAYELFRVRHDVMLYPLQIDWPRLGKPETLEIKGQEAFEDSLKAILASEETRRVISTLLAQVKASAA